MFGVRKTEYRSANMVSRLLSWTDGFAEWEFAARDGEIGVAFGGRVMAARQQPKGEPYVTIASAYDRRDDAGGPPTPRPSTSKPCGLAAHYRRSPDQLSEEEVRAYLVGCVSAASLVGRSRQATTAFNFSTATRSIAIGPCFQKKDPPAQAEAALQCAQPMPKSAIFSPRLRNPIYKACCTVIYACGLRAGEGNHS